VSAVLLQAYRLSSVMGAQSPENDVRQHPWARVSKRFVD
jgi:hypothetical protein